MKKCDLIIFYRSLIKNKQASLIKIFSLAIGLACVLVIFMFINNELSYDRFHKDSNNIYRIEREAEARGRVFKSSLTSDLVGKTILNDLPEVTKITRLFTYTWKDEALIEYGDKTFFEKKMFLVDPSFFDLFSFKLIRGDKKNVFSKYNAVVLSKSCAKKYFGEEDPLGKIIVLKNQANIQLIVGGIIEDAPQNSHFSFDVLLPLEMGNDIYWKQFLNNWNRSSFYTYIQTQKKVNIAHLESKINAVISEEYTGRYGLPNYSLKSLTSIHLNSHYSDEIEKNGNVNHVFFAIIIGIIICLISLSNFVNITIAQVVLRAKEVGVKKIMGGNRLQLFFQFIKESILLAFVSMIIALIIVEVLISPFIKLLNINLNIYNSTANIYISLFGIVVFVGFLAGLFPAIAYSTYNTIDVLKGKLWKVTKKISARRLIMLTQFAIVAVLLICTIVVTKQKQFLINNDPGFSVDNVIVIPMKDYDLRRNYSVFKSSLQSKPFIKAVTSTSALPMSVRGNVDVECEGFDETIKMTSLDVDFGYIDLFNLKILIGRAFDQQYSSDAKTSYIINQTAAKALGWKNPLGKTINYSNKGLKIAEFDKGKVIGVVKDFYHTSKHSKIQPLIIKVYHDLRYVAVRYESGYYDDALRFIKTKYEETNPNKDFSFFLGSQKYDELYQEEKKMNNIFLYSTGIAIIIAILGLFSLSSLEMKRKYKEIGIRKVFGANTKSILLMYLKQYSLLVLISCFISFPIAWSIMNKWLLGFAYAIEISVWYFVFTFLIIIGITIFTVTGQSIQATSKNPIDALKYE